MVFWRVFLMTNCTDTYKDSGIEWIGEIPQEWSIVQVKNLFNIGRGRVISQLELDDNGEYPVYSSQTQNNGCLGYIKTYDFDTSQLTWTTDGANAGTVFLREGKHNCTNVCGTLQPKNNNINLKYMLYNLVHTAHYHKRQDTNGYKIMNNEMAAIKLCVPILSEQQQIADYLDKKCGEIDRVVETEKAVIEKLKEYKQSIITETVTKGLDKSVPLKDSGIEWIGKIPQHWGIEKLKNLFLFGKGLSITKDDLTESGISVISYGQIHSKTNTGTSITDDLIRFVPDNYLNDSPQSLVNKGDFIFADTSEDIEGAGNCVFVDKEMTLFAGYHSIILKNKLSDYMFGKYLSYLFKTIQWRTQVRSKVNGIKVYSISQKILKEITVIIPKQQEQQQIAEYLDKKCSEIDKAIADKEQVIEKFKEYKKSLIYECVTGKRKVC